MTERLQALVSSLTEHARRLVMVAALLGVALHMDATAADSTVPKWLWLGVAGGLLPALAALRLWWGERLRLPPKGPLLALGALAGALTLAYLLSPYKAISSPGWQAWLMSLLLFCAAVDLLSEEAGRRWLLGALMLAGGLAGAWSLAQRLGLDPTAIGRLSLGSFGPRIAGPLGNPNFAGGFFVLLLPVLLHQALAGPNLWWRRSASLAALLALLGLGLSASKAAFFGLAASAAVAGHLLFWSRADAAQKKQALYGLGSLLLAGLLAGLLLLQAPARQRLLGGPTAWEDSVSFRRLTWAGSLQMIQARPVLGWGPGAFSVAYPAHRPPEAMRGQVQHSYEVTHPENWVLQVAVESGLLGLGALGFLFYLLLWPLRRLAAGWAEDPVDAGLGLAVLSAIGGSLACNLASLDFFLPSTLLPFLFIAALGMVLSVGKAPALSLNAEAGARFLVSLGLAFMATVPIVHAQMKWQSSRLLLQARSLSQAGQFEQALPAYQWAVDMDPLNLEARYFLARNLQDLGPAKLGEAETAYQELARLAPDYVLIHANRARLYTAQKRLDLAEAAWRRQLQLDPYLLQAVQELSSLLAGQGRLAEAEALLADAVPRFPDNAEIGANLDALRGRK
jgi:O-antigen ligase